MTIDLSGVLDADESLAVSKPPMNREANQPFYFDIETVPDFSRRDLFGLDEIPAEQPVCAFGDMMPPDEFVSQTIGDMKKSVDGASPPDEWLDAVLKAEEGGKKFRAGVADLVKELRSQRDAIGKLVTAQNKQMSVTPEMLRIVAVGFAIGDDEVWSNCSEDEVSLLDAFWSAVLNNGPLIGFNILEFDLPAIFARSVLLGVKPSRRFDTRPWGKDVCDLMYERFPKSKAMGLKPLARMYGIEIPEDDVDGSQVLELWQAREFDQINRYVISDVEITRQLHRKWSGFFC